MLRRFESLPFRVGVRVHIPAHLGAEGAAGIAIGFDRLETLNLLRFQGDDSSVET